MKRLIMLAAALLVTGCRTIVYHRDYYTFSDKIENEVIIGFGVPPQYMINTLANRGLYFYRREQYLPTFKPGEKISFFCLATYSRLSRPVDSLEMEFEIVDATGKRYIPAELSQSSKTGANGYNQSEIYTKINKADVYRLKATYKDKNTTTISYSPNFLVWNPIGTPLIK